jgi:hypothetical protein
VFRLVRVAWSIPNGSDAIPTALVRTCCKLVANLLTPVKVGGAVSEAADAADVDEVAIIF